ATQPWAVNSSTTTGSATRGAGVRARGPCSAPEAATARDAERAPPAMTQPLNFMSDSLAPDPRRRLSPSCEPGSVHQLLRQIDVVAGPAAGVRLWVGVVGVPAGGVLEIEVVVALLRHAGGEFARMARVHPVIQGVGGDVGGRIVDLRP